MGKTKKVILIIILTASLIVWSLSSVFAKETSSAPVQSLAVAAVNISDLG